MAGSLIRPNEAYLRLPRAVVQAFEEMRSDADADDWVDVLSLRGVEHALREYAWSLRLPREKPGVLFQELLRFRELVERRLLAGSESIRRELLLSHIDRMLKDAEGSVFDLPPLVVEPQAPVQMQAQPAAASAADKRVAELVEECDNATKRMKDLQRRVDYWRQEYGKLDARSRGATEYKKRAEDLQRRVEKLQRRVEELELTVESRDDRIRRNIEVSERQIRELQAERDGWKSDAEQRAQNAEQHKRAADAANQRADRAEADARAGGVTLLDIARRCAEALGSPGPEHLGPQHAVLAVIARMKDAEAREKELIALVERHRDALSPGAMMNGLFVHNAFNAILAGREPKVPL